MTSSLRRADAYAVLGAVLVGVYFAFGVIGRFGRGYAGFDVFAYTHPNFLYAWEALRRGDGLLWNDLQNCGQPFFAIISTALLNPVSWISLVAGPETALLPKIAVNLAIGGIGMYFLCREIGLGRLAAFCGTLAFELGGVCGYLGRWGSFGLGPYVWLPATAFACERILRAPSARGGIGLGIVLSLQLLAGYPQILIFAYQWIALRALWEAAIHRRLRVRALGALALGLLLPPLLGAVQLVPSAELVAESVRDRALTSDEIQPSPAYYSRFEGFRRNLEVRMPGYGGLFPVVAVALAGFAFAAPARRRLAAFYLASGGLYFALAFFSPLFELYQQLPIGRTFRDPTRFVWMTGFAFSVLVAWGVHAFSGAAALARRDRAVGAGTMLCGLAAFHLLSPIGFMAWEWGLLAVAVAMAVAGILFGPLHAGARLGLAALLACNLFVLSTPLEPPANSAAVLFSDPVDPSLLWQKKWAFDLVKRLRSDHDRMYPLGEPFDYSLTAKSASVFGVPSIADYEPQTSKRYAELFVRMLSDKPMIGLNQFYYPLSRLPRNRELLNLLAARYLVVDTEAKENVASLHPALRLLERRESVSVYENQQALPRAFYVPQLEVVRDPGRLLDRLASRGHRPRRTALIEEPPADGFLGLGPRGTGSVEIAASRGEELVVHVLASQAGFLFVSDQYYPGWEATVDGSAVPIHRANYAFRVVRVPEGESMVVFRYRPESLRIGAAVSGISLLALVVYAIGDAARRRLDTKRSGSGSG